MPLTLDQYYVVLWGSTMAPVSRQRQLLVDLKKKKRMTDQRYIGSKDTLLYFYILDFFKL